MAGAVKTIFYLETLAQRIADFCFMLIPRKRPSRQRLADCRLVSHRGEHDNRRTRENTLAAFRAVAEAGIWGIEFDVRWTRDLHPVVIHDPTSGRVFDKDLSVADVSLQQLRRQIPEIPTLEEVVAEFGGHTHLMVELKRDRLDRDQSKAERLAIIFSALQAGRDFHFLALQADLFEPAAFAGASSCLLVAELDINRFSQQVIEHGYGGLCGQYLLMSKTLIERHQARGQKLGSGFPASRQCFYRELNRGVDWVFTNHALKLGAIRRRLLDRG
jgi:glycerophosphoryl diester phosphodiesterase